MIKVTAKVDETGTAVRMEEMSGNIDSILDETAGIVAAVVGNILANGQPTGVRPKEFEAFIMQQINKRAKEAVKQLLDGEAQTTDTEGIKRKGIVTPKKRTIADIIQDRRDGIDVQPEDEKKGFLN